MFVRALSAVFFPTVDSTIRSAGTVVAAISLREVFSNFVLFTIVITEACFLGASNSPSFNARASVTSVTFWEGLSDRVLSSLEIARADLIRASHLEIGVTGTGIAVVAFREVVPNTNPPVHVGTKAIFV